MVESKINNFSKKLEEKGILIRDFTNVIKNHYRITVGTKEENKKLLNAVKEILKWGKEKKQEKLKKLK